MKALPILKNAGVTRSALFGSYIHGAQRRESDVDMLVELPEGKNLFDLVDLKERLEEVLDKKVDLLTYNSLHPLLREKIMQEQVQIL